MAEKQDAMQVRSVIATVMKELLDKAEKNPLPAEGTSIEVQWADQDENYPKCFFSGFEAWRTAEAGPCTGQARKAPRVEGEGTRSLIVGQRDFI
jgi:hypothetical protein